MSTSEYSSTNSQKVTNSIELVLTDNETLSGLVIELKLSDISSSSASITDSVINQKLTFSHDSNEYDFNLDDLTNFEILAQTRNVVKKCLHKPSETFMAVKYVRLPFKKDDPNNKYIMQSLKEITLYNLLPKCEYIVEFYGCGKVEGEALICMELMDMSLLDIYKQVYQSHETFPEELAGPIAVSVVKALSFCKQHNLIHRDVKPLNILINRTGEIKLCDFGESRIMENSLATTQVGTIIYWPPERLNNTRADCYDVRSDVWGLGLTLLEVIHGNIPWADELGEEFAIGNVIALQMYISNIDGNYLAKKYIKPCYSYFARDFITKCLSIFEIRPKYDALQELMFFKMYSVMNKDEIAKLLKLNVKFDKDHKIVQSKDHKIAKEEDHKFIDEKVAKPKFKKDPIKQLFNKNHLYNLSVKNSILDGFTLPKFIDSPRENRISFIFIDYHKSDMIIASTKEQRQLIIVRSKCITDYTRKVQINKKWLDYYGHSWHALRQIRLLGELKHPNIIELLNVYSNDLDLYFICDGSASESLLSLYNTYTQVAAIRENYERVLEIYKAKEIVVPSGLFEEQLKNVHSCAEKMNPRWAYQIVYQIISACHYIHSNGLVHGQLSLNSFLVSQDNKVVLTWFGSGGIAREKIDFELIENFGLKNLPPEVGYHWTNFWNYSADTWNIGIILAMFLKPVHNEELIIDRQTWDYHNWNTSDFHALFKSVGMPDEEYLREIPKKDRDIIQNMSIEPINFNEYFTDASEEAVDLLSQMLNLNPTKRISIEEAIKHPYFKEQEDLPLKESKFKQFSYDFDVNEDELWRIGNDKKEEREMILKELMENEISYLQSRLLGLSLVSRKVKNPRERFDKLFEPPKPPPTELIEAPKPLPIIINGIIDPKKICKKCTFGCHHNYIECPVTWVIEKSQKSEYQQLNNFYFCYTHAFTYKLIGRTHNFRGKFILNGKRVFICTIKSDYDAVFRINFLKHLQLYKKLKHVNMIEILNIFDVNHDDRDILTRYFVYGPDRTLIEVYEHKKLLAEYMQHDPEGSSNQKPKLIDENWVRLIMCQIMSVVNYLHAKGLVHCMLELECFLIDDRDRIYLTNFGCCAKAGEEVDPLLIEWTKRNGPNSSYCPDNIPFQFISPEIAFKWAEVWDYSADIWGIGMILAHLLKSDENPNFKGTIFSRKDYYNVPMNSHNRLEWLKNTLGNIPINAEQNSWFGDWKYTFTEQNRQTTFTEQNFGVDFNELYTNSSNDAIDLLKRTLIFDHSKRLNLTEIKFHPFFKDYKDKINEYENEEKFEFELRYNIEEAKCEDNGTRGCKRCIRNKRGSITDICPRVFEDKLQVLIDEEVKSFQEKLNQEIIEILPYSESLLREVKF